MPAAQRKPSAPAVRLPAARARPRPFPVLVQPDLQRRAYFNQLRSYVDTARRLLMRRLSPVLARLPPPPEAKHEDAWRTDASFSADVRKAIRQAAKDLLKSVPNATVAEMVRNMAADVSATQRAQLRAAFRASLGIDLFDVFATEPNLKPAVDAFTRENVELIRSIPAKYFAQVEAQVLEGVRAGMRPEKLAELIAQRTGVAESRAALIARDQVGKFYGALNVERQRALGVQRYRWRTMRDNRVREAHEARDGDVFTWDSPPPDGHPGHSINCFPGDARITSSAPIQKLYRRWYSGQLTELVTDAGESLRATPNHPVLTQRGWIPAQLVDVGDDVFEAPSQGVEFCVRHPESADASMAEVFRALAPLGVSHRMVGAAAWFHGDTSDEEVDVVDVDWSLGDVLHPSLTQRFCHDALTLADQPGLSLSPAHHLFGAAALASHSAVRGFCKLLASFGTGVGHADEHRLTTASWLDAVAEKARADGCPAYAEVLREALDAPPGLKEPSRFLARVLFGVVCRAVVGAPRLNTASTELDAEVVGVNAQRSGHLVQPHPLLQHRRRVVEKRVREFSGHVYNLQTVTGWYVVQSLVVHNCRCFAEPMLEDLLGQTPPRG